MRKLSIKKQISIKISRSRREVFLRSDFEKLAGYDQVGRALRQLSNEGTVVKIGYGLYAKARPNKITGETMLAADGGFLQVAEEALRRLKVNWKPSESFDAYQAGSTQIPANAQVIVKDRFSRQISTDKFKLEVTRA